MKLKHALLIRHLIVPLVIIEAYAGWHPLLVWVHLPISMAWAVFLYSRAWNDGWLLVYGGAALNKICMIANGGYMPVGGGLITATEGKHTPLQPDHVLVGLADIHGGASIGDFLVLSGLALVLVIFIFRKKANAKA